MASNHSSSFQHISKRKQKEHRYLTIAEKMEILDMKKEGESSSAIARHFGVSRTTILETMKVEDRIRKTADSTFNMSTKLLISPYYKPLIFMETALIRWIEDCRQKNIALDLKIIQRKAMSLFETFSSKETDDIQDGDSSASMPKIRFFASRKWFYRFRKRYGYGSVLLKGNAASNDRIATKTHMKISSHSDREYEREPVSNVDESGTFTKHLPAQIGWTSQQLAHVLNLAKQLKENSQKCDDDMDRCVQFCSRIDDVINQYRLLYNQTVMQRRQLTITLFFHPLKIEKLNEVEGADSCNEKVV